MWPNCDCTYNDVINEYVSYVVNNYGTEANVCFDGYCNQSMSTKFAEQCRRTAGKNVSPEILFEIDMPVVCNQSSFLGNHKNKARLISALMNSLTCLGVQCKQSQADADFLICNSAIELANGCDRPVILVGKDTDLLVMLIVRSCPNLYMQYAHNAIYSISCIREALPSSVSENLLIAHAITGCDTVSAMYKIGKKTALNVLQEKDCGFLDIFKANYASHDQIWRAGEMFVLMLYKAKKTCKSLDNCRYFSYMRMMKASQKKISYSVGSVQLETLPPTSAAMKYHAYRAYFAVQEWLGNSLQATDWGWELNDGTLTPIYTDRPAASDSVLRLVSCGCKKGCGKRCSCRKAGLDCSAMCSTCIGQICTNALPLDGDISDNE